MDKRICKREGCNQPRTSMSVFCEAHHAQSIARFDPPPRVPNPRALKPNNYGGRNAKGVREVLALPLSDRFLTGTNAPSGVDIRIVDVVPADGTYAIVDSDGTPYYDVRESMYCPEVYSGDEDDERTEADLSRALDGMAFFDAIQAALPERWKEHADWIHNDLQECVRHRAAHRPGRGVNCPMELMTLIYLAGCWPVGWSGSYPKGQFLVIVPGGTS